MPPPNRLTLPNTRAVKILAWVFPAFFVLGIVAAIALPAYQQYVMRAKAAQIQAQPQQQQQP
jgi:Tfp pilus assembly major pilin PilA